MANEEITIAKPVSIVSDAKQRVAFDLMHHIGSQCYKKDQEEQKTKDYWLKLYRQCYKAADGDCLQYILEEK